MSRSPVRLLAVGLVLAILAACSQAPVEPKPFSVTGVGVDFDALPEPVLAAGTVFMDPDADIPLIQQSLIEIQPGIFLGELSAVGPSGEVTLVFPDGDDLPGDLLKPAQSFFFSPFGPECTLAASDPSVLVTAAGASFFFFPGVVFYTPGGVELGMALSQETVWPPSGPSDLEGVGIQTWVYADGPVNVTTDPFVCGDEADPPVISVDVQLQTGWNQVEWVLTTDELDDPVGFHVQNSTADELFFYFGAFL